MADIPRVKGNIAKMIAQGAPEADIDAYISGEGVSLDMLRGSSKPAAIAPAPDKYQTAATEERDRLLSKGVDTGTGFARMFIHGQTLGLDDEILAALQAPIEAVKHHTYDRNKSFLTRLPSALKEGYNYAKAREDLIMDDSRKETGVLGTIAEMGGGVGTGINAARSGITFARNLASNAGLGARSAAAAGDGIGFGLLSGAAEGNSLSERGGNAALGGVTGGVLGGAMPGVTAAVGQVAAPFISNIRARMNPQGYATNQIARALSESGRSAQQVADDVATAAREGQDMFTVADALGNPGQRLLSSVSRAPGAGRTEAVEFLERRQSGQGRRISNALSEGFDSPQTADQVRAAMTRARDTAADAAYGAVRSDAGPVDVSGVIRNIDQTINPSAPPAHIPQQGILSPNPAPSQASPAFSGGGGILDPHFVSVPGGSQVSVVPRVVEASSLKTSSDPGYNAGLQPRDRSRAASDGQVRDIARNLNPERLGRSAEADRGAPIVGPDSMVESGNGRVAAIRQAYSEGGPSADNYRQFLAAQGVDVSQYREPVLIRERATPMNTAERQAFTVGANQGSTLTMSAPERALADARLISGDALSTIKNPADLASVENREFVRQFAAKLPQTEQGSFVNAHGHLSSEGATRVRNAVLAKAYGDSPVLTRVAESTNDEIKSISNALTATAPEWAAVREGVASGAIPAEMDITADLLDAVARTAHLRSRGGLLSEGLSQTDAFSTQSPTSEQLMRLFYNADGKRAASSANITQALRHYAQEAVKAEASPGLMMGLPPVSPSDILGLSAAKVSAPTELSPQLRSAVENATSALRDGAGIAPESAAAAASASPAGPGSIPRAAPPMQGAGLAPDSAAAALRSFRDRMTDGHTRVQDFNTVQRLRGDLADAREAAHRAGQGNRARLLGGALRELDTALETASGGFREANRNFAQASRNIDAIDQGRDAALRGRTEDTIPTFRGLSPEGQTGFRAGYVDPLIQQTQGAAFGANKARPLINDAFADESAAIAPMRTQSQMQRRIERENTMFETRNHALGGSKTHDNGADSDALGIDPRIITNILDGNIAGAARNLLLAGSNFTTGNTAQVREALAGMLLQRGQVRSLQQALTQAQALIARTNQTMQLLSRGAMGGAATLSSQRQ